MDASTDNLDVRLHQLGLDPAEVRKHERLLTRAVREQHKPTFPIRTTCRLENGGILPLLPLQADATAWATGYIAFVLAAGAASRYSQPLYSLSCGLEEGQTEAVVESLTALAKEGALDWPLPASLATLVANPQAFRQLDAAALSQLARDINLPKALMPCVREGLSFLAMKHREHSRWPGLSGELFIVPPGQSATFAAALAAQHLPASGFGTQFLEQGPQLSTLRFYRDGQPVLDANGDPSVVPAGHGAIARLFPAGGSRFPGADSLFIRNIDNVMGTSSAALQATGAFLAMHRQLLDAVQSIRRALGEGLMAIAGERAATLLRQFLPRTPVPVDPEARLWAVQSALFHTRIAGARTLDKLRELYARPVNLMGQVPNTAHDVGGTPCFIAAPDDPSATMKMSLEVPHASADDRERYLANSAVATHFNPGFCAVEIPEDPDYYVSRNRDFWLLAEKTYQGKAVMYYETVLYELLGNSEFANTVFAEVPRLVFHPHKALRDAMNQQLATWLKD